MLSTQALSSRVLMVLYINSFQEKKKAFPSCRHSIIVYGLLSPLMPTALNLSTALNGIEDDDEI